MTIAICLMADSGIILAADRQETAGYQKTDTGKIRANFKPAKGSLIVTGAGSGTYLDALAQQILSWFSNDDNSQEASDIADFLATTNRSFYTDTVIPFSGYPDHERPDYSLLIGCDVVGSEPSLFETDRLAFKVVDDYAAVGLGASTAKTLLSKFYIQRLPISIAISLAAFVMYEVKASVEGCGLGTDVFYTAGHVLQSVGDEEVLRMENAFRLFHRANAKTCTIALLMMQPWTPSRWKPTVINATSFEICSLF